MDKLKLLLIISALALSNQMFSQDLIIKTSGEEIESKVIEITDSNIKYRKYANSDGPIYNISKSEVFMIKYENGGKDVFNKKESEVAESDGELRIDITSFGSKYWQSDKKISRTEFKSIIREDVEAENAYMLGSSLRTTGLVIGIPAGLALGWQLGTLAGGGDINTTALALGGAGFVGSIVLEFIGRGKMRESINIYNKGRGGVSFKPGFSANGVGLFVNF